MKQIIFSVLVLGMLYSCGSEGQNLDNFIDNQENKNEPIAPEIDITLNKINDIPAECEAKGKVVDAYTWSDLNGVNYFIRTLGELQVIDATDEFEFSLSSQYLYAYHYVETLNGEFKLLRETTDFVKDCEFDLLISHELDAISLTDFDQDEIGEITFVYRTHCTSDVSPSTQKLIMLEDGNKYPLRGTTKVFEYGGEYTVGDEFKTAPAAFLEHAKQLWSENLTEYDFEM